MVKASLCHLQATVHCLFFPTCSLSRPTAHPNHNHKLHVCSPPLLLSLLSLSPFPIRPTDRHSQTDTQSFVFPVAPTTTTTALALAQCVYDVRTFRARAAFPLDIELRQRFARNLGRPLCADSQTRVRVLPSPRFPKSMWLDWNKFLSRVD